ncbi:cation diffusion facilitator family transporter [Rhizobium tubonense]|uniref:Cation transporter n=1 Tax=Rhizobium tubonense TaxID=484088 RepID=A0A2W4CSL8_9HYPH|nr:cation diffusion facilitator family transporter [Rhizobium tubonense]PZM15402.1 cation transporter [Rhizobium tubonense]
MAAFHGLFSLKDPATRVVVIALISDLVVAAVKVIAGFLSNSSAMTSEGVHTLVDASTEIILLYGMVASRRGRTPEHQLGFGRELYFWNFVVAVLILALGSGIALVAGARQITNPVRLQSEWLNFFVLGCSGAVEAAAMWKAFGNSRTARGNKSLYRYLSRRRDPTSLTVLFGGIAAIVSLIATALGLSAAAITNDAVYDGVASIAIATILAVTAIKLAADSKSLLIGVPADPEVVTMIVERVKLNGAVETVNGVVSVHLSPDQLLIGLSVAFKTALDTSMIENAIIQVEASLRNSHPQIVALFIKPQSHEHYSKLHECRVAGHDRYAAVVEDG